MSNKQKNNLIPHKTIIINKSFFIFCFIISILLIIRDVYAVNIPKTVFLILTTSVFILYDMNYTAIFICFLIPLIVGLPGSYIFSVGFIIFLIKNSNKLILDKYLIPLVAIFFIELLSFIYGNFSILNFLRFAALLIFISFMIFNDKDNYDYKKMLLYFLFAAIIAELSILFQSININGLNNLIESGIRLGQTNRLLFDTGMRISYNPNSLGILSAISISILLSLFNQNIKYKILIVILLVFQIFIGSMSLSVTFLILLGISILIYWLSMEKSIRRYIKNLAIVAIIIIGAYLSINYYTPTLVQKFSSRLAIDDISDGRIGITELYFDALVQHPERIFFGVGLQDYQKKSEVSMSCHNGLQEILITWGIVGIFWVSLYIFFIYKYGWRGITKKDRKIIYLLPLIIILVGVQSGQFFSSYITLYFLPIYATMRLATNPEITKKTDYQCFRINGKK